MKQLRESVRSGPFQPAPLPQLQLTGTTTAPSAFTAPPSGWHAYRITNGAHTVTGLIVGVPANDCRNGVLLRHEKTLPAVSASRGHDLARRKTQDEPVALAGASGAWSERLDSLTPPREAVATAGPDERKHLVWPLASSIAESIWETGLPQPWIADGHHRVEVISSGLGTAPLLAVLFPSSSLQMEAVHRGLCLDKHAFAQNLSSLEKTVAVQALAPASLASPPSPQPNEVILCLHDHTYSIRPPQSSTRNGTSPPLRTVDLAELALSHLVGTANHRPNGAVSYFGGDKGAATLVDQIRTGKPAETDLHAGLFLPTGPLTEVEQAALSQELFPAKSTWFLPKPLAGLVSLPLS